MQSWHKCCSIVLGWVLFGGPGMGVAHLTWDGCCLAAAAHVCLSFFSNLLTFCCLRAAGRLPTDML